jgi:hypothetical protein
MFGPKWPLSCVKILSFCLGVLPSHYIFGPIWPLSGVKILSFCLGVLPSHYMFGPIWPLSSVKILAFLFWGNCRAQLSSLCLILAVPCIRWRIPLWCAVVLALSVCHCDSFACKTAHQWHLKHVRCNGMLQYNIKVSCWRFALDRTGKGWGLVTLTLVFEI